VVGIAYSVSVDRYRRHLYWKFPRRCYLALRPLRGLRKRGVYKLIRNLCKQILSRRIALTNQRVFLLRRQSQSPLLSPPSLSLSFSISLSRRLIPIRLISFPSFPSYLSFSPGVLSLVSRALAASLLFFNIAVCILYF